MSALAISAEDGEEIKTLAALKASLKDYFEGLFDTEKSDGNTTLFKKIISGAKSSASAVDASAGKIKIALAGISGGAKAAWASLSLIGKASIAFAAAVVAIKVVARVVDALTISAAEAKEKLDNLRSEYNTNESELQSVNSRIKETQDRIGQLKAMGKLTFTEREELDSLQKQNAELERQKSLLEAIKAQKQGEVNSAFVEAMQKSVDNNWQFQGFGKDGAEFYGDRHGIDTAINDYERYTEAIAHLDEKYANNLTDPWYKKMRAQYEDWKHETVAYLTQKNKDFADMSEGISYGDDEDVNQWLDYINDFQDKMNILFGGEGAKTHALTRVATNEFSDVTASLRELGEQGSVTADMLSGADYADFVAKMVELGVISAADEEGLQLLADAFNGLGVATDVAASGIENVSNAEANLKQSSDDTIAAINGINAAQKALASQGSGKSISLSDFSSDEMKDYASALEYVNGVYQLNTEKVNELVEAKANEQIAINETNKALDQKRYLENAKQIEKYRVQLENAKYSGDDTTSTIENNIAALLKENSAIADNCRQYDLMNAALAEATGAYQNWINAQNASEAGDMFDGALGALKHIDETLNNEDSDLFGRVGRADYKAAVDFVIPDTIDKEDSDAVNSYLKSVSDMFTYDGNGNRNGLNIWNFVDQAIKKDLLVEDGNTYRIAGQKTMEDFADGLGLAMPLVRAMFGELEEFGAKFDWADEATETIGDIAIRANESAEALRGLDQFKDTKIVLDVSDFKDADKACATLESTIDQMQNFKSSLNPDIDQDKIQQASDVIQYCVAQKQILSAPAIMSVDTSKVEPKLASALELLQQFQDAVNDREMAVKMGADTSDADRAIDGLTKQIQGIDGDVLAQINLAPDSADSIESYIAGLTAEAIVNFGVDSSAVEAFENSEHTARGTCIWYQDTSRISSSFRRPGYIRWENDPDSPALKGGPFRASVSGSANAYGSARTGAANASGDWRAHAGRSLVGELGKEIIVNPNTGRWYTVGDDGAEFVDIPEGAIIFNHKQSEALLEYGKAVGRGTSYASGSAFVTGYIPGDIVKPGSGSGGRNPGYGSPSNGAGSSIKDKYNKDLDNFDWIEIAINRIELIIRRLGGVADSVFKSLKSRMDAATDKISMVTKEIDLQQRAYDKYMSAAESVSLSSDLKKLVRDGAIDISQYDEDTTKLINDYKDLYEKALDCSESIDDLHESLAQIYKDKFDAVQNDYNNRLELMSEQAAKLDNDLKRLTASGYNADASIYESKIRYNEQRTAVMKSQLQDMQKAFNDLNASGYLQEGSEAWYEMMLEIQKVKNEIDSTDIEIIELKNTIRQLKWDSFDHALELVSELNDEADFLINLLKDNKMSDEAGNLTSDAMAVLGMHAQKMDTFIGKSQRYAEEISRLDGEISKDPLNQTLIERRKELLKLQRESILAAKDEKTAMKDLISDGFNAQLESLRKLIDAYNDSLDSAKDLYEFQKSISDKAGAVSKIEKQLAAYQGDNSQETRAAIQKLKKDLERASSDLQEAEYDRVVSDTKKVLDELYDEYEKTLNAQLDNIDELVEKLIGTVNDNTTGIMNTIRDAANKVGIGLSDEITGIWSSNSDFGTISSNSGAIADKMSSVLEAVNAIYKNTCLISGENPAKSFSSGGIVDYTGMANVHGTKSKPELVLNSKDAENFLKLRNILRSMQNIDLTSGIRAKYVDTSPSAIPSALFSTRPSECTFGDINIGIDHVENYDDFVYQLQHDKKFEGMIQAMTVQRLNGKSQLNKYGYSWATK